jgi:4-hydroxyacetophenone monooxygenase
LAPASRATLADEALTSIGAAKSPGRADHVKPAYRKLRRRRRALPRSAAEVIAPFSAEEVTLTYGAILGIIIVIDEELSTLQDVGGGGRRMDKPVLNAEALARDAVRPDLEFWRATDETIADAVGFADPMVLRGLLFQLTGDDEILALETEKEPLADFFVDRLAKPSDVDRLREKAVRYIKALRDGGPADIPLGPLERIYESLSLTAGHPVPRDEWPIWLEASALDPWARGADRERLPTAEQAAGFKVAVIGTGLSGLDAAAHLKRAGIPFIIFEKNPEVGGTWFENRYPGARVDSPSRSYTHLFGIDFPYPFAFCPRDENLRYMQWVAESFGLREHVLFNSEVTSIVWDDAADEWEITANSAEGRKTWRVNAVISCVGFLSRPQLPQIEGMDAFQGVSCHTAKWPDDLDVAGKRVAVIGSGASGYQTTPVLAKTAARLHLFQRSPSWCFENPSYVSPLPRQSLWLDRNFPYYVNYARFRLSWQGGPRMAKIAPRIDPEFSDPYARSAYNKRSRDERIAYIRKKLATRPELIEKMIPSAPPLSSRPIMIDTEDSIYEALLRDNVTLVSDPIERITPTGIQVGGQEIPLDVIVYATGFRANEYLWPMEIRGRHGVRLEDLWAKDGPRAYLGSMLPGFPNFFMSYGPNSNNFGGFQVVDFLEIVVRFALQCIAGLAAQDKRWVEVTDEAYWRFNEELDREEKFMIYMDPRAHNYYQNGHGRSCVNGPVDFRRMWRWLRDPAGPALQETDAGLRPYFGEDLVVG